MASSEFDAVIQNSSSLNHILHIGKYFSIEKIKILHRWEIRKTINDNELTNPVCKESLKREFEIGSQLQHTNICSYYQLSNDGISLNREFIDGLTWTEFFETYSNEKIKIEKYVIQLLDALHYMHAKGIFHMDLKSENIIISHELKTLKIIDFGHAVYQNDTLWRGGNKTNLKYDKLISAEQDWNSFFTLLFQSKNYVSRKSFKKIENAYKQYLNNNNRIDIQFTKDIFENQLKRSVSSKVIVLVLVAIFIFFFVIRFSLNSDKSHKRINNKRESNCIETTYDSSGQIKKVDSIQQVSNNRKTFKNETAISYKDSIFLVQKANEFGPDLEKNLKPISSKSKLEIFDSLVKAFNFKFDSFKLIQNLDSNQIETAKKIYFFHISKSINKYVHLLK
jgi:serine/threonine protein kinase